MKKNFDWLMVIILIIEIILVIVLASIFCSSKAHAQEVVTGAIPLTYEEMARARKTIVIEIVDRAEKVEEVAEVDTYLIDVTDEEIDLMARVVMSEASTLSNDAKQAIATTIVNRVRDNTYEFRKQDTVTKVINHKNAYATGNNGEPTQECYDAVFAALTYEAFPVTMFYFREGKYHSFGKEYANIGTTYFSMR